MNTNEVKQMCRDNPDFITLDLIDSLLGDLDALRVRCEGYERTIAIGTSQLSERDAHLLAIKRAWGSGTVADLDALIRDWEPRT
jgi:hypothetical protein